MDSKIGLLIQLSGVALITLLTLFLGRSIKIVALRHWTNAWLFLCFSLFCLRLAFSYGEYSTQLFSFYFLTGYLFGFMLIAGCRSLADNSSMRVKQELFILPFVIIAFALPFLNDDLDFVINIHSLILAGFFAIGAIALGKVRTRSFGWRVMMVALVLLCVNSIQYFAIFWARQYVQFESEYLQYNSIVDLVLQTLLGFGMVIVLLENVVSDAKTANESLKKAQEKLEALAHVDPLTTALNRHAFHGYVKNGGGGGTSGCVGFFDIDDLKVVNDGHGHAAGDAVIRAVVRGIRDIIRAEDLIFRWGGDEFFVIMVGLKSEAAEARMSRLERSLTDVHIDGVAGAITIGVSHAFADFDDITEIDATIKRADERMYRQKQLRKALNPKFFSPDPAGERTVLA